MPETLFLKKHDSLFFGKAQFSFFPGKSIGSGFSLSGETFRSPYQIGVGQGPADDGKRV